MKLYTAQVCPFAHRVRLVLAWKGLSCERIEIDLANMPDWYRQLSPNQKVPLLLDGDDYYWESALINEYLEEGYPQLSLYPEGARARFRSRLLINWAEQKLIPPFYGLLRNSDPQAAEKLQNALQELTQMCSPEGPYLLGPKPSLADAGIYPWFERWLVLEHYRQLQLVFPARLAEWLKAVSQDEAVQAEAGSADLYIPAYLRYAQTS
jgi:glutathione S-transferase